MRVVNRPRAHVAPGAPLTAENIRVGQTVIYDGSKSTVRRPAGALATVRDFDTDFVYVQWVDLLPKWGRTEGLLYKRFHLADALPLLTGID